MENTNFPTIEEVNKTTLFVIKHTIIFGGLGLLFYAIHELATL